MLVCVGATVGALLAGCQSSREASPVVPLVVLSDAVKDELRAQGAAPTARRAPGGDGASAPGAGAAGEAQGLDVWVSAAEVEALVAQCDAEQPEPATLIGRSESGGNIWRGSKPPPDGIGPPEDGVFQLTEGDPEFLDPNLVAESAGTNITSNLFEGLLVWAAGNSPPVPSMATGYTVSEDGKTYTFTMREGVTWSDGVPLTAEDFRYSWLRGLHPDTNSQNAQQIWRYVKGAEDFFRRRTTDPADVAIRVPDPRTLIVELVAPTSFFPDLLTYIAYAPVPRHAIEAHGKQWVRPGNIVVNGPYTLTEWSPRDRAVLEKNPRYWAAAEVEIPKAIFRLSDDEAKNRNLYDTGQAHYIQPLDFDDVEASKLASREDMRIDQIMCVYYYVMNTQMAPFDDPRIRRAFNMAIQLPATHLLPDMYQGTLGFVPPQGPAFDPAGARALLAEAGYPGGVGLPKVELIYNTYETHRQIAEFFQRNIKENLGIEVAVQNMEWKSLLKQVHGGQFQISRTSWCADYPDPMTFLDVFHSESENNYPQYRNPAYDDLLARIARERDTRKRNVLLCAADKVLTQDMPLLPFYFYTRAYMLRPWVKGFEPQYQDHHLLRYLSIDTSWRPAAPAPGGG